MIVGYLEICGLRCSIIPKEAEDEKSNPYTTLSAFKVKTRNIEVLRILEEGSD